MCYVRDHIWELQHPLLRFARSLCKNPDLAEDLVSVTTVKALTNAAQFRDNDLPSLRSWTFTILRNAYYSSKRVGMSREISCMEHDPMIPIEPAQNHHMDLLDAREAIVTLIPEHQVVLAGVEKGLSYNEISEAYTLPAGTTKSRLNRARNALKKALNADELG